MSLEMLNTTCNIKGSHIK